MASWPPNMLYLYIYIYQWEVEPNYSYQIGVSVVLCVLDSAEGSYKVSSKEQNNCLLYGIKWPNLIAYFHGFKQSVFVYFLAFILHMKERFLWLNYAEKDWEFSKYYHLNSQSYRSFYHRYWLYLWYTRKKLRNFDIQNSH